MGAADGNVLTAGLPVGKGLSKKAAAELGLAEGTPVGSGLIDASVLVNFWNCKFEFEFVQICWMDGNCRCSLQRGWKAL